MKSTSLGVVFNTLKNVILKLAILALLLFKRIGVPTKKASLAWQSAMIVDGLKRTAS